MKSRAAMCGFFYALQEIDCLVKTTSLKFESRYEFFLQVLTC